MIEWLLAALVGYLLGSLSSTRLVGRFVAPGEDLTETVFEGDDGPVTLRGTGATAIAMRAGPRMGCLTSVLDILKGVAAVLIARWIWDDVDLGLVAGAASVWGHVFPVFHRFKGGKGMSPILGATLVIDWVTVPVAVGAGVVIGGVGLGDAFAAYGSGPIWMIPLLWVRLGVPGLLYALAINLPYWWAVRPELKDHVAGLRAGGSTIAERRSALLASIRSGVAGGRAPWAPEDDAD